MNLAIWNFYMLSYAYIPILSLNGASDVAEHGHRNDADAQYSMLDIDPETQHKHRSKHEGWPDAQRNSS